VPAVVALWHAPAGSAILAELREERHGAAVIVTSLGEVAAFCQAAAGQEAPARAAAPAASVG
jgi:uroporphyrinogen-III synthase